MMNYNGLSIVILKGARHLAVTKEPSQAEQSSQEQKNYLLNVFQDPGRIFCSYCKLEKLLAAIKSFYVSKEVKEFTKILLRQKAQETHQPYDFSIGKDNICSVKNKYPLQHTPPVFLRFKFYWSSTFCCWARMGQGVYTAWQKALLSDVLLLFSQFPVVKRD